jgi:hypothetical protein
MADVKYYTVVLRDAGAPATGKSPTIDVFANASNGTLLTPVPTITEISGGIYRFSIDWDNAGYSGVGDIVLRVDSNDTGMSDSDRYIYGSFSKRDNDSIYTLTSSSDTKIDTILTYTDVQIMGDWIIESNQLKLYDSSSVLIATYDLFDIGGSPTSLSATSRVKV